MSCGAVKQTGFGSDWLSAVTVFSFLGYSFLIWKPGQPVLAIVRSFACGSHNLSLSGVLSWCVLGSSAVASSSGAKVSGQSDALRWGHGRANDGVSTPRTRVRPLNRAAEPLDSRVHFKVLSEESEIQTCEYNFKNL